MHHQIALGFRVIRFLADFSEHIIIKPYRGSFLRTRFFFRNVPGSPHTSSHMSGHHLATRALWAAHAAADGLRRIIGARWVPTGARCGMNPTGARCGIHVLLLRSSRWILRRPLAHRLPRLLHHLR